MFDELDKQNNPPAYAKASAGRPSPLYQGGKTTSPAGPVRAEDIFAEVDKTAKPEVFKPSQNGSNPPRGAVRPPEMEWKSNKKIVISLLFFGLIIIAAGGYFGYKLSTGARPAANNKAIQEQPKNSEVKATIPPPAETNEPEPQPVQPPPPADSDLDGLTDQEEAALGADPYNADTDQDGLTDREEVKVYLTNPLEPDTDGDSYNDGDEISNGYNPKGAGKLLQIR